MRKQNESKTIAITGATGFVGAHFVRHFSQNGYKVIAIGRQKNPPENLTKYATWLQADITTAISPISADVVIHCAGLASDRGTYEDYYKVNVLGTKNVFEASPNHRQFICISSASVYSHSSMRIREEDVANTMETSMYGATKRLAEVYLQQQTNKERKVSILRPRAIYGTHDRVLLPRILNLVKRNRALLPGHLNYKASMTSIHNLIHAVELVMSAEMEFAIYNVADEETYSLREVIEKLLWNAYSENISFRELPLRPLYLLADFCERLNIPSKVSKQSLDYLSHHHVLSLEKITSQLGYKSQTNFSTELVNMRSWIEKVGVERVKKGEHNLPWLYI